MNFVKSKLLTPQYSNGLTALLLLIVCFFTYSNALRNDFMIDDYGLFLENSRMHHPKFLLLQFIPDVDKSIHITDSSFDAEYRPLSRIIPMVCYMLFGQNPFGYHAVNLLLFYAVCFSIYGLLRYLNQTQETALVTGLLFCVHPINAMLVNYITASVLAAQILAMIGSVFFFCRNLREGKMIDLIVSFLLFIAALLCHEVSMTLPLYLVLCIFFFAQTDRKKYLIKTIPFFFLLIVYLIFRMFRASLKTGILDKIVMLDMTVSTYAASLTKLIFWYFQKIVTLKGIVLIWAMPVVKEHVVLWLSGAVLFFLGIIFVLFFSWKKDNRSLALIWLIIGLLPVGLACFFQPQSGLIIEPHWLFFPSIGIFLLLSLTMISLKKMISVTGTRILIGCLILASMFVTRWYNGLWGDEKRYCLHWLKESPTYKDAMFYLANVYMEEDDHVSAKKRYLQALANRSNDWQIYNNLGLIAVTENSVEEAVSFYQKAVTMNPVSATVYNNLGLAQMQQEKWPEAEHAFLNAIKSNHYLMEPRINLAELYGRQKKISEAVDLLKQNLSILPEDEVSLFVLTKMYLLSKQVDQASDLGKKFLNVSSDVSLLIELGENLARHRIIALSLTFFGKAKKINPRNKDIYLIFGKAYGNLELFDQAIDVWKQGLVQHENDSQLLDLIQQAQALKDSDRDRK